MIRIFLTGLLFVILSSGSARSDAAERTGDEQRALEIYRTIVGMRTAAGQGQVPRMAQYLSQQLKSAGFAEDDIEIIALDETAALIVRYRATTPSTLRPILFLAHMDVVDAKADDWELDPFTLNEQDGYYIGRGTSDNKYGVMNLTQAFMRLKESGFTPARDLIIAFSGDEETSMLTTRMLADRADLQRAGFALNSDAGGGTYSDDDTPLPYRMQSAEKTYATFELTARNRGGHSSRPRRDNAIYELADALKRIEQFDFPATSNAVTRPAMRLDGSTMGGLIGAALVAYADDPTNIDATAVLRANDSFRHMISTTCVATMLSAGHAENALPQSATATVNCRIFPGVSVAQVQQTLMKVVGNDKLQWTVLDDPVESPVSEPRDDVIAAIGLSIHRRFPDAAIIPSMSSGGTDGMHFRRAGVPTYGASPRYSQSGESNAHGLNERMRISEFYAGLDHWLIVIKALAAGN